MENDIQKEWIITWKLSLYQYRDLRGLGLGDQGLEFNPCATRMIYVSVLQECHGIY